MAVLIDAFTSGTLKYLRERWWNDEFTEFLVETLRPRAGNRILDVGCGEGLAEVHLGHLHLSQIRWVGVDLMIERVMVAKHETAGRNQRVGYATADACALPFRDGSFDSTFCIAVLQHVGDHHRAVGEFSRVTATGGRVVAVEPDNKTRYIYASVPSGQEAFTHSARFFAAVASARGEKVEATVGPRLAALFAEHRIEPLSVRIFPVASTILGTPAPSVWKQRRSEIEATIASVDDTSVASAGRNYLEALMRYERDANAAGQAFVEIQNTMLFATVGQKT